jgi:hypothetical protein
VLPSSLLPTDIICDPAEAEFRSTNLKTISVIRLDKLATIHARGIVRNLGNLHPDQRLSIAIKLRQFLRLD